MIQAIFTESRKRYRFHESIPDVPAEKEYQEHQGSCKEVMSCYIL